MVGVNVRAGTPKEIVDRLNREIVAALAAPQARETLSGNGIELVGSSPAEYDTFICKETAQWSKVVKSANVHAE